MSTCCSMALVTVVAMASCTSNECTRGPTVSRYRCASFGVRWPQNATKAGVVSSTANTTQTTTPIDRPVLRRSAVGGAMVWVDPVGHSRPPRSNNLGSHHADLRFRNLSAPEPPHDNPSRPGPT